MARPATGVEGHISTEFLEPEGPFGESHGHVNPQDGSSSHADR
jgi:UbiD family decarboxylase